MPKTIDLSMIAIGTKVRTRCNQILVYKEWAPSKCVFGGRYPYRFTCTGDKKIVETYSYTRDGKFLINSSSKDGSNIDDIVEILPSQPPPIDDEIVLLEDTLDNLIKQFKGRYQLILRRVKDA